MHPLTTINIKRHIDIYISLCKFVEDSMYNMYINSNATSSCNMVFIIIYSFDDQFCNLSDIDITRT